MGIRPIVSSCNSITESISQFVDRWLQPHVTKLPSYLKDSTEFIHLIETTKLPTNCFLASIDVSSLYTNIPHNEGIQSTLYYLKNDPEAYKHPEQPTPEVITELMEMVLKNNVFEFNDNYYLQIQGTAMGTKMAPAYANLFMGKLEQELKAIGKPHILIWKRFIDDIFIIWSGSKTEFTTYMNKLNKVHNTIKFTHEISDKELTFLDVILYKDNRFQKNNILDIRTHIKPTNKQLYIHATSYHPPNTIAAISKGETKRYLRTNSSKKEFETMTLKLIHKLKHRGYKQDQILKHIRSVKFDQRSETLSRKKKKTLTSQTTKKLVFVTQFCDDAKRLKQTIKKHWKLIQQNSTLRELFPEPPTIAYRRNPSLRNKLVRAKLKPLESTSQSTLDPLPNHNPESIPSDYPYTIFTDSVQNFRNPIKKCCKACLICSLFETKCFVESTSLKQKYPIHPPNPKQSFNCKTKNVIYLATCTVMGCRSQYVGYTTRQIMFRVVEHLQDHKSPIRDHCDKTKHDIKKVKFQILAKAPDCEANKEIWLKRNEYLWICRLGTLNKLSKKGLNKMAYDPIFHSNPPH